MADIIPTFLTKENPLFSTYAFHSGILCFKMLAMSPLTGRQRIKKKVFANEEDAQLSPEAKIAFNDPDVERVRRAHLNDLENIPPFLFISCLYVLTSPEENTAINLFRAFTTARIIHTVVYAVHPLPQPARGLAWGVGFGVTAYMLVQVIKHFR